MNDLESRIAGWRKDMRAAGIKAPVPLDELESHLREDIERHVQTGMDAPAAFERAIRSLGEPGALSAEFKIRAGHVGARAKADAGSV